MAEAERPWVFASKLLSKVAEMHVEFRRDLFEGRYDWYKPIHNTVIEEQMKEANRDLQHVQDKGSLVRGPAQMRGNGREGKLFTFQANQPITQWASPNMVQHETVNFKGQPIVEEIIDPSPTADWEKYKASAWVRNNPAKFRSYSTADFEVYSKSPNLSIRKDFHLIILGLDKKSLTVKELYQEIYVKIQTQIGSIEPTSILVIDNETLMSTDLSSLSF